MQDVYPRNHGTVYILGAGASYGALLPFTPPPMKSFIKDGINLPLKGKYDGLWNLLSQIGISLEDLKNGTPNLEELYLILEHMSSGLWYSNEKELLADTGKEFWKILPIDYFESFIFEVLNKPSVDVFRERCRYHDTIIKALKAGDTIISFNYDLIADASVAANWSWSEFNGYGFWNFDSYDDEDNDVDSIKSDILLLKPHGSINWGIEKSPTNIQKGNLTAMPPFQDRIKGDYSHDTYAIKVKRLAEIKDSAHHGNLHALTADFWNKVRENYNENDLWKLEGTKRQQKMQLIYPPSFNKMGSGIIPEEIYLIWAKVRLALLHAARIVCIGFSFTPTDVEFSTLFRIAIAKNENNPSIIVVNPDEEVKNKINRLAHRIKIKKSYTTLEEFAASFK